MSGSKVNEREKIFVLDTSVILYDHNAFENFQEHDVALPIQVLEELDNMKSGNDTRNFEARSFIRLMDNISRKTLLNKWVPLKGKDKGNFKVVMDTKTAIDAEAVFGSDKIDNRILNAALALKEEYPAKKIILVSKDICLRLKAKALDLYAEDYETGKVKNLDQLYTGETILNHVPDKLINQLIKQGSLSTETFDIKPNHHNHFYILNGKNKTASGFFNNQSGQLELISEQPIFNIQ